MYIPLLVEFVSFFIFIWWSTVYNFLPNNVSYVQLSKHTNCNAVVEGLDDNFSLVGSHHDPDVFTSPVLEYFKESV